MIRYPLDYYVISIIVKVPFDLDMILAVRFLIILHGHGRNLIKYFNSEDSP
jgi:hypothetical protein